MSILVRVRGLYSMGSLAQRTAVALLLLGATTTVAQSNVPKAELKTYQRDGGQTYFAISLSPQPDAAQQNQARDVVILFDTSASQAGMYRETALAAVDACLAKLGPQDRVQIVAADLEARPVTNTFLSAGSDELRAAVAALRNEPPLGSTDIEQVLRTAAGLFDTARPAGRTVLYVGDGLSTANLVGTPSFRGLTDCAIGGPRFRQQLRDRSPNGRALTCRPGKSDRWQPVRRRTAGLGKRRGRHR